jgi:phosphoribosyl-ATP pyrophosphohydrolase/phosphoribosyl-AMP cyclohydrolase
MIVPSIDIVAGRTVQLVGGREQVLDAGDPIPWLERFGVVGDVAVVDLDAARGIGSNRALIAKLCARGDVRVGGGIRDYEVARFWLDAGATRIVIGTAAEPALLRRLPRDRVIVALDADEGDVVVEGWTKRTGRSIESRLAELRELAGGFLVTFVEREGRLGGTDLERSARIVALAGDARVTIAGGVTTPDEVAALDRLGADAQVGMALYTGRMSLGAAFVAPFISDRGDGLIATIVTDALGGAFGLTWSSRETMAEAVESRTGVYCSRRRGRWVKGQTSGATQALVRASADCDRDAVRFVVRQQPPGFCHTGSESCWGTTSALAALGRTLATRVRSPNAESYSTRLLSDRALLASKLREEAEELALAVTREDVIHEAADLIYFTLVRAAASGVSLPDIDAELGRRSRRVSRRGGDAKAKS